VPAPICGEPTSACGSGGGSGPPRVGGAFGSTQPHGSTAIVVDRRHSGTAWAAHLDRPCAEPCAGGHPAGEQAQLGPRMAGLQPRGLRMGRAVAHHSPATRSRSRPDHPNLQPAFACPAPCDLLCRGCFVATHSQPHELCRQLSHTKQPASRRM